MSEERSSRSRTPNESGARALSLLGAAIMIIAGVGLMDRTSDGGLIGGAILFGSTFIGLCILWRP